MNNAGNPFKDVKYSLRTLSFENLLDFDFARYERGILKQPLILHFLSHKSATTRQIDLNEISDSKLKPDQCNCV